MRRYLLAALALATLAGCGAASAPAAAGRGGAMTASANTTTRAALITVPAAVFANCEDHLAKLKRDQKGRTSDVWATVTLVASRDGFKREKREARLTKEQWNKPDQDKLFILGMLHGDVAPGEYAYYLVMKSVVARERAYGGIDVEELPDFYVSDYGKNYKATLK